MYVICIIPQANIWHTRKWYDISISRLTASDIADAVTGSESCQGIQQEEEKCGNNTTRGGGWGVSGGVGGGIAGVRRYQKPFHTQHATSEGNSKNGVASKESTRQGRGVGGGARSAVESSQVSREQMEIAQIGNNVEEGDGDCGVEVTREMQAAAFSFCDGGAADMDWRTFKVCVCAHENK